MRFAQPDGYIVRFIDVVQGFPFHSAAFSRALSSRYVTAGKCGDQYYDQVSQEHRQSLMQTCWPRHSPAPPSPPLSTAPCEIFWAARSDPNTAPWRALRVPAEKLIYLQYFHTLVPRLLSSRGRRILWRTGTAVAGRLAGHVAVRGCGMRQRIREARLRGRRGVLGVSGRSLREGQYAACP